MGYISELYVVDKYAGTNFGSIKAHVCIDKFFGYDHVNVEDVFKNLVNYDVYIKDGNVETIEDEYGDPLKDASPAAVVEYLENWIKEEGTFHQSYVDNTIQPAIALLKAYAEADKKRQCSNEFRVIFYAT